MTTGRQHRNVDEAIGQATIAAVSSFSPSQLLAAVTPERIGELTGYSASSIRYRLNGAGSRSGTARHATAARTRGWSFDREQLLTCAVDAYREHALAARGAARDRYLAAMAAELPAARMALALEAALEAEVHQFASGDAERFYLVALAGGRESPAIARVLREVEADRRHVDRELVDRALRLLGREALPGLAAGAVGEAVSHYLHGLALRRSLESQAGAGVLLRAVLGIVLALSQPVGEPTVSTAELLGELRLAH